MPGMVDDHLAIQLADFVNSLRRIDTLGLRPQGSLHSCRADPIERRDSATRASIAACGDLLNGALTEAAWGKGAPGHRLRRPSGVDALGSAPGKHLGERPQPFGRDRLGWTRSRRPAIDCLIALTLLTPSTRHTFRLHVDVDEGTWTRGRAWALSIALVALPYYRGHERADHGLGETCDCSGR